MNLERRPLVTIAGVGVAIDPSWLIVFALVAASLAFGYFPTLEPDHTGALYWSVSLVIAFLFFASVLLHELSHALVSNHLGIQVKAITLFIFGGVAHLSSEPREPSADLKIAAAGPATSFALGALFASLAWALGAAGVAEIYRAGFRYLAFANVALALFNSLPGLPLDGGRIARSVFWRRSGDFRAATIRAAEWGGLIASGLMALGVFEALLSNLIGGLWLVLIGMFLRAAAESSRQGAIVDRSLAGATVEDLMISQPVVIGPDVTVEEAADGYFLHYGFGGFPVVESGRPVGVLSLLDVRGCPRDQRSSRRVREIMRRVEPSLRIAPTTEVTAALRQMVETGYGRLLVTDGDRLLGLITRSGIARVVHTRWLLEASAP